jgi:CDP-paratose 2-epimerase
MGIVIVTGSNGLVGSEVSRYFCELGYQVIGIDNNLRMHFFGQDGDTRHLKAELMDSYPIRYKHFDVDIRNFSDLQKIFGEFEKDVELVVHAAAQPSHDWAARDPHQDFYVNSLGTLNLLECVRKCSPDAVFVFMSTNKVYGDSINSIEFVEEEMRFSPKSMNEFANRGINESLSIDNSTHSIFGVNKIHSDLLTQEYGRYFGIKTTCLRGGCLSGPSHKGAELHGFLSYLVKCAVKRRPYTIYGYKGKQVRDNLHSKDVASAVWEIFNNPGRGDVFNLGGGIHSNISILEAIDYLQKLGHSLSYSISDIARVGDHRWWITDTSKFTMRFPNWKVTKNSFQIIDETIAAIND